MRTHACDPEAHTLPKQPPARLQDTRIPASTRKVRDTLTRCNATERFADSRCNPARSSQRLGAPPALTIPVRQLLQTLV